MPAESIVSVDESETVDGFSKIQIEPTKATTDSGDQKSAPLDSTPEPAKMPMIEWDYREMTPEGFIEYLERSFEEEYSTVSDREKVHYLDRALTKARENWHHKTDPFTVSWDEMLESYNKHYLSEESIKKQVKNLAKPTWEWYIQRRCQTFCEDSNDNSVD